MASAPLRNARHVHEGSPASRFVVLTMVCGPERTTKRDCHEPASLAGDGRTGAGMQWVNWLAPLNDFFARQAGLKGNPCFNEVTPRQCRGTHRGLTPLRGARGCFTRRTGQPPTAPGARLALPHRHRPLVLPQLGDRLIISGPAWRLNR